jgi:hypothetical protein
MFGVAKYLLFDDITINPVDLVAEKRPVADRLYERAVETTKRKEEAAKVKRLDELRQKLEGMSERPYVSATSKALSKSPSHAGHFYEYNRDWKQKVESKLQIDRDEKEAKRILEVEDKKMLLKEYYEKYQKDKEKIDSQKRSKGSRSPLTGEGKKCPPKPPAPSSLSHNGSFQASDLGLCSEAYSRRESRRQTPSLS